MVALREQHGPQQVVGPEVGGLLPVDEGTPALVVVDFREESHRLPGGAVFIDEAVGPVLRQGDARRGEGVLLRGPESLHRLPCRLRHDGRRAEVDLPQQLNLLAGRGGLEKAVDEPCGAEGRRAAHDLWGAVVARDD